MSWAIRLLRGIAARGTGAQTAPDRPAPPERQDDTGPMVMHGISAGMFACVHVVAEYAHIVAAGGHDFVVRWPNSPYRDSERPGNPWEYYFEPVFPGARLGPDPRVVQREYEGRKLAADHMFHPRLVAGMRDTMGLPPDRAAAGAVLERFIRLNRTTRAFIDDFATNFFTRPVIGLHMRGPGRVHGGALQMRAMVQPDGGVPYELYFGAVDAALETHPDALVFGCSDSQEVIDAIRARYGDRALFYPSSRSDFGEMHEQHPENAGHEFSPYKLGLDVVVEAHLLARCVHFVHGNSNVANYVLCRAPDLPNTYVYEHLVDRLIEAAKAQVAERSEA